MEPVINKEEVEAILNSTTAPRVTDDSIKSKIDDVEFIFHGLMTICIITMKNGFRFIGDSTPASPENYDKEVGKHYAYKNAFKKIWPYEGYLLCESLSKS